MLIPQPVSLQGGVNAFARNVVAKYNEVSTLCARENEGPNDRCPGDSVCLVDGDADVTSLKLSGGLEGYTVDHGRDRDGRRVFESFRLNSENQLHYTRAEDIQGLQVMDTEWLLGADGSLTTKLGSGAGYQFTNLQNFGDSILLK